MLILYIDFAKSSHLSNGTPRQVSLPDLDYIFENSPIGLIFLAVYLDISACPRFILFNTTNRSHLPCGDTEGLFTLP